MTMNEKFHGRCVLENCYVTERHKRFFGKPCKKCGDTQKYISNRRCVSCMRKKSAIADNKKSPLFSIPNSEITERRRAIEDHQNRLEL